MLPRSVAAGLTLFLLPILLAAQPRELTFSLTRKNLSPLLEDYFAPFSLRYPGSWIVSERAMENGSYLRVYTTARTGEHAGQISHQFSVGPLTVPWTGSDSTTMRLVMQEADQFEQRAFGEKGRREGTGFATVDGVRVYELRNSGPLNSYSSVRVYGRFLFVPPTATSGGLIIGMTSSGFNPEIGGGADVGVSGEMAGILRSMTVTRHAPVDPATPIRFASSRDKFAPPLQPWYLPLSFERPRSWELKAGPADPRVFAIARRGVTHGHVAGFTSDLFGIYPLMIPAISDPAARAATFRTAVDTLVAQNRGSWKSYSETSRSRVKFLGRDAEEVRFVATHASQNAEGVEYYGVITIVEPTATEPGCTIVMQSNSLSPGITGPEDVGRKGELLPLIRSFRFERRKSNP